MDNSERPYNINNKTVSESDNAMYINTVYKWEKWQIFQEKKKKLMSSVNSGNIEKKTLHSMEVIHI